MLDDDLRVRAHRLASGHHRVEDLDRLFLGLRDRDAGRMSVREIGDFVAHRGERQKGPVTQTARDVFTSVDVWSLVMRGRQPSHADIARAAWANFRLASDLQLRQGCGLRRPIVRRRLESGLSKFARSETLTEQEADVIGHLGNRFIWKPAFDDEQLFKEFQDILITNKMLPKSEARSLGNAKTFLTLYAIALMHGVAIEFDNGTRTQLRAGFANRQRRLEVKVLISFDDLPKPVMAPICMFLTSLEPEAHCDPALLKMGDGVLADAWGEPIEVGSNGKLTLIGKA